MNTLQQKIESLIFYKNEPVRFVWLAKQLGRSVEEIFENIQKMIPFYEGRGIQMIVTEDSVALLVATVSSQEIAKLSKNEEERELSKQAFETLAIILYKGNITKAELDYIRGVNSVFILRNLLMRGLIEKQANPKDKRSPLYTTTHDTLAFLGISQRTDLPDYNAIQERLSALEKSFSDELNSEQNSEIQKAAGEENQKDILNNNE